MYLHYDIRNRSIGNILCLFISKKCLLNTIYILIAVLFQGLTQTFMSSGPQDHKLRGSGGPTIFLVVLTTTNVATLENLETIFFTLAMCFHIVNFVNPLKP